MQDCLKLLHFHLGSQITNIRIVKGALNEAARVYTELAQARRRPAVHRRRRRPWRRLRRLADQLRVEHELHARRNTPTTSSITSRRSATKRACRIRPSSPRAAAPSSAYHSVLVFNVLGVSGFGDEKMPTTVEPEDCEQPLVDLIETYNNVTARNALESYPRRAAGARHGAEPVQRRLPAARAALHGGEPLLGDLRQAPASSCQTMDEVPEDLQNLDEQLSDTYFCNFSLFQSIPDSWAIKQLFPVMPIHRLNEQPTQPRGARRHHLRLRRQARSVHRSPRRQEDAAAAPVQRRAVLPRRVPGRRVSGDPRRPAQPVRRHPRRARQPRRATATCVLDALIKGDTVREVLDYVEFDAERCSGSCATTSKPPCARAASTTRSPAGSSSSTKTACTATRIWKIPKSADSRPSEDTGRTSPGLGIRKPGLRPSASVFSDPWSPIPDPGSSPPHGHAGNCSERLGAPRNRRGAPGRQRSNIQTSWTVRGKARS